MNKIPAIARIYALQIKRNLKTIDAVPDNLKEFVLELLKEM